MNLEPQGEGAVFERGVLRMLLITSLVLTLAGFVDILLIREAGAAVQPVAALIFAGFCLWMLRTDRLYLYPLLITIAVGAWSWIALMLVSGTLNRLVDPTSMLLLAMSGFALAALGGNRGRNALVAWLILITSASSISIWAMWGSPGRALSDAVVTATISFVGFTWVAATRDAADASRDALAMEIRRRDELVASVSHELRTPIAAVVGLLEELTRAEADFAPPEREELMDLASQQSREVAYIVEDLLVAARNAGGELSTSPMSIDLAAEVISVLEVIPEPFAVEAAGPVSAFADPARTRQIVRNLATNAVRYGGPARRVVVGTNDSVPFVEVRDSGTNIAATEQKRMFEPFERAARESASAPDSVGLGLSVARSLAGNMGGSLTYTHDGSESVFRLRLLSRNPSQS